MPPKKSSTRKKSRKGGASRKAASKKGASKKGASKAGARKGGARKSAPKKKKAASSAPAEEVKLQPNEERYFESDSVSGGKFWTIEVDGNTYTTRWGKLNTNGASNQRVFANEAEAMEEAEKLVGQKLRKGYAEQDMPSA